MSTQIHDLGYRSYDGPRAGVGWAVRSLITHSIRRVLGLKRAGRHKIVPVITIALAFVPALIMVGIAAFLPGVSPSDLISYGEYFGPIAFAIFLFAAAAAPGVLTTDRTSGMLALYLASPLNRTTYVIAKAVGIFLVMLLVTFVPILFLILAYTLVGDGPGGPVDFIEQIVRAMFAGTVVAAAFTGIGMVISSIPKRWGIASVSIVAVFVVPTIVVTILTENSDVPDWVSLLDPATVLAKSWEHLIGDVSFNGFAIDRLSGTVVVLTAVAYGAVSLFATWWRYQRVAVDR